MSHHELDFAVMEVGLGGRLDAVNILDADCVVIMPIGLDHQEYLGPDRETIGREKAGIIRPGVPLVCGEPDPPDSVLIEAARQRSPLRRLGHEFEAHQQGAGVQFRRDDEAWILPLPAMLGDHQVDNMATAVAALLEVLPEAANSLDLIACGLQEVRVPGRMQQLARNPLVLVDVGHNPMAAAAMVEVIRQAQEARQDGLCRCVIGMLGDKDAAAVATVLGPVVNAWYCAGLDGSRSQSGEELVSRISPWTEGAAVSAYNDVASALGQALQDCQASDCLVVFGSFLTAAAAMTRWKEISMQASASSTTPESGYC